MTPERWQQIEKLYDAACVCEPAELAEFLEKACAGDDELRREIEWMLVHQQDAKAFIESPALEAAAQMLSENPRRLLAGTSLGPYEGLSLIGKGGMGEVYKARDTRLHRYVAIKVLPDHVSIDPQLKQRFRREAQTLAQLSHPNICPVFDLGEHDGVQYLVMEFLEGETLAERLKKRALPRADALKIAIELADALDKAHTHGVIHRDLKPSNVMLTKSGCKLLDFGLAKFRRDYPAGSESSPTRHSVTTAGTILGTLQYMAPEQLEGKEADATSDIFCLGLILYEMTTGRKAFDGDSQAALIAQIMQCRPAPMESGDEKLTHIVERCLAGDPDARWQTAKDVKAELVWAGRPDAAAEAKQPAKGVSRRALVVAVGLLALGSGLGWSISHFRQPPSLAPPLRLTVNPPPGTDFHTESGAAISPDGRWLVFVASPSSTGKLWVRPLDSLTARELPGTEDASYPFWSADSRSIGFFAGGKLKRIEIGGGPPTAICDVGAGRGGTWNKDGVILFNSVNDGPILRVLATGGTPAAVTTIDKTQNENSHRWPHFLPDGRQFLYFIRTDDPQNSGVYAGSLDHPQEKIRLVISPTSAVYAPDSNSAIGHLLWVREGGVLLSQAFDPEKRQLFGESMALAQGVFAGGFSTLAGVTVASDGTLVYAGSPIRPYQLTWYGREGKPLGTVGQPDSYLGLRVSSDNKRVALFKDADIWQMELARGLLSRLTSTGRVLYQSLAWSQDSQWIAYTAGPAPPKVYRQRAISGAPEERLVGTQESLAFQDWSSDGKFLLYLASSNDIPQTTHSDLFWREMMEGKTQRFLTTPFREAHAQFAPDTKWVAYTSNESGQNEIFVRSFPSGDLHRRVSSKGGDWVRWRSDGKELFYIAPDRKVMSVMVRNTHGTMEFENATPLFTSPIALPSAASGNNAYLYDVTSDGQRFLVLVPVVDAGVPPITVMLNWQTALAASKK